MSEISPRPIKAILLCKSFDNFFHFNFSCLTTAPHFKHHAEPAVSRNPLSRLDNGPSGSVSNGITVKPQVGMVAPENGEGHYHSTVWLYS